MVSGVLQSGRLLKAFFMIMYKGVTTNCSLKRGEARNTLECDEIVCSAWEHAAPWHRLSEFMQT